MIKRSGFVSNSSSSSFIISGHPQQLDKEITYDFIRNTILDPDLTISYNNHCSNDNITMDRIAQFLLDGKGTDYSPTNDSCNSMLQPITLEMKKDWIIEMIDQSKVYRIYGIKYDELNSDFDRNKDHDVYWDILNRFYMDILNAFGFFEVANLVNSFHNFSKLNYEITRNFWDFEMDFDLDPEIIDTKRQEADQAKLDLFKKSLLKFMPENISENIDDYWKITSDPDSSSPDVIDEVYTAINNLEQSIFFIVFDKLVQELLKDHHIYRARFIFEVQGAGDGWKSAESEFIYNKGLKTLSNPEIQINTSEIYNIIENAVDNLVEYTKSHTDTDFVINYDSEESFKKIQDSILGLFKPLNLNIDLMGQ